MDTKLLKGGSLFFACECICFAFLNLSHQTFLKGDIERMAFYDENYPTSITFFGPILIGVGLILFIYSLDGKVNSIVSIIPVLIGLIFIINAAYGQESDSFYHYIQTYGPYLAILAFIWGGTFILHTIICRHYKKNLKY